VEHDMEIQTNDSGLLFVVDNIFDRIDYCSKSYTSVSAKETIGRY
jgi:hypothetical protein